MYVLSGVDVDGYPDISAFAIDGEVDASPAKKTVTLVDNPVGDGATLASLPQLQDLVREVDVEAYKRFTTQLTNLMTNPSFEVDTSTASVISGSTLALHTDDAKAGDNCLRVTTPAGSGAGVAISFTATAAAHSTSVWVLAPLGAAMAIKYDGGSNQAFVGTGAWQKVKLENVVLTGAVRQAQIIQTTATAQVFYVDAVCTTQSTTANLFFCGTSGDAKWNGTPHASTSTTLTGEAALNFAQGVLSQCLRRAEALSGLGGVALRHKPGDCPFRGTSWVITGELTEWKMGVERLLGRATGKLSLTCLGGIQGPEYLLTTLTKLAGVYALDSMLPAAKGDAPGPGRFELKNRDALPWRYAQLGLEQRYASAATPRLVPASSMTVLAPSTSVAAVNQSVTLTKSGTISSGSGQLYIGDTALAIAFGTAAAAVQTAIEALTGIGVGNVTVTGGPLSSATPMVITFVGALAGVPINLRWDGSGLGGGGSVAAAITAGTPAQISAVAHKKAWTDLGYIDVDLVGDYEVLLIGNFSLPSNGTLPPRMPLMRMTTAIGDAQPAAGPTGVGDVIGASHRMKISLGEAHFSKVPRGTQSTRIRIQAKAYAVNPEAFVFVPVAASSVMAASQPAGVSRYWASDTFSQSSGALGSPKVLDSGQSWNTGGAATDFQVDSVTGTVSRSTTGDAGAAPNFGGAGREASVAVAHQWSLSRLKFAFSNAAPAATCELRFFVNWIDANNYFRISVDQSAGAVSVLGVLGGVPISGLPASQPFAKDTAQHQLEIATFPTGRLEVWIDGYSVYRLWHRSLLPGGALASGVRSGWIDMNSGASACVRTYDDFDLLEIRDLVVAHPARVFDARAPIALTENSAGGTFAPTDGVRMGKDPMILPAGIEGLQCRVVATMNRENPDIAPWDYVGPAELAIYHTPVYDSARWEQ